ncbi:InlB B-repeat-containing protein, partial [Paenibacillus ferrarius]|uniref:InlB B-repeat-containing protein n=1 Tax=Paenibacillus ferrarius TaxID=1469647 RepID=UPI003D2BB1EA
MSVLAKSLRAILASLVIYTGFSGVASASVTYDSDDFSSINKADNVVSDNYFSFSGEDTAATPNTVVGVDEYGIYLMKNDKINPSNAASGTIHIKPKDAGKVFTLESLYVNAAEYGNLTFSVRFNNGSTPETTVTVNNSNRDSVADNWNYKRITFGANAVTSVDIDIVDTSNSPSPHPVAPAVGQNSSIVDFVIAGYPTTASNYTLTYTTGPNGTLSGTSPQTIASGGNGTAVTAVPNAGYHFLNWSDGST